MNNLKKLMKHKNNNNLNIHNQKVLAEDNYVSSQKTSCLSIVIYR